MHKQIQSIALAHWLLVGVIVGAACGPVSALFLALLELATRVRTEHDWLIYLLPAAGIILGAIYAWLGKPIQEGSNLIINTLHENGPQIPSRMAPMVLAGTIFTHLFGGSAGREGAAMQMGAAIADTIAHRSRYGKKLRYQFLAAGVAGGFGSVFGTPVAGALFGAEFIALGKLEYTALLPALVASVVGDRVARFFGAKHTLFVQVAHLDMSVQVLGKWLFFACTVAVVAAFFIEFTHVLKRYSAVLFPNLPLRMAVGGIMIIAMWKVSGTTAYLGLGIPSIVQAFSDSSQPSYLFAVKGIFTAVTLGVGFLGGEVVPLFFMGSTLGNTLAQLLDLPLEMGAGVGMIAMFAAASNTPLALSIMAVELMGREILPHAVIVCVIAYILSGHRSIYPAQRVFRDKYGQILPQVIPLSAWHVTEKDGQK